MNFLSCRNLQNAEPSVAGTCCVWIRNPFSPKDCSIFCLLESFFVLVWEVTGTADLTAVESVLGGMLHEGQTALMGNKSGRGFGPAVEDAIVPAAC